MHPDVRQAFRDILRRLPEPERVVEIGQDRDHDSLVDLPELTRARERFAVGLSAGGNQTGVTYIVANANDLSVLPDGHFDLVLCNSMLEHDPSFWLSLAEMRRVTRSGGHMIVGVPGFSHMASRRRRFGLWLQSLLTGRSTEALAASSSTLGLHAFPDDFYRFSRSAVERVFLHGFEDKVLLEVLDPPRIIGLGRRFRDDERSA